MLKPRLSSLNVISKKLQKCNNQLRLCSSEKQITEEEKEKELARIAENIGKVAQTKYLGIVVDENLSWYPQIEKASLDSPPTGCCQSGCSNCVFIVWAEALSNKMEDAGPEIADKIMKMVDDPSMKAYLEMELRLRRLKK